MLLLDLTRTRLLYLGDKKQRCDLMVKEVDVAELRKRLGIKKLKKKIPISDAEKEEILQLREHDKRRVTHAEKLKA